MCNAKDAERLVADAKMLESTNPQRAREHYLEAGEIMLHLSMQDKEHEQKYLRIANQLYEKIKTLDPHGVMKSQKGHHGHKEHDHSTHTHKSKHEHENAITPVNQFTPAQFIAESKTTFQDIGGLEELKEEIRFKIIEPLKHPEVFSHYGKKMGGGIIMYGPPGCGKTLIAKATANEANATFFHVKSSDLKSKWVGETEKNIAELFDQARKKQPSIIFFDEFEALGRDRTESQHAHDSSMVSQLLAEMDGMHSKDQQILLLAATNEPWLIDSALRREGRFGETLFIPPPDKTARECILRLEMKSRPVEDIDFERLASLTENYSGADLKGLCESATNIPLKESFITKAQRPINMRDFYTAKEKMNSIIVPWFKRAESLVRTRNLESSFESMIEFIDAKIPATLVL